MCHVDALLENMAFKWNIKAKIGIAFSILHTICKWMEISPIFIIIIMFVFITEISSAICESKRENEKQNGLQASAYISINEFSNWHS